MGSADPPGEMDEKLKSEKSKHQKAKTCKKEQFSMFICYILRAIRAGRCREWHYADHIFVQIYFRMHHFVVIFSGGKGALTHPPNQNPADVPGVKLLCVSEHIYSCVCVCVCECRVLLLTIQVKKLQ